MLSHTYERPKNVHCLEEDKKKEKTESYSRLSFNVFFHTFLFFLEPPERSDDEGFFQ